MKRRIFNVATLLSLVLFLAAIALWARGYWWIDFIRYERDGRVFHGSSGLGSIDLGVAPSHPRWGHESLFGPVPVHSYGEVSPTWRAGSWRCLYWFSIDRDAGTGNRGVRFPSWLPVAALSILPAVWLRRRRREPQAGGCAACGYNLRGTPGSTCPECGALLEAIT